MACLAALSGFSGAASASTRHDTPHESAKLANLWIAADFDGDREPELVNVDSLGRGAFAPLAGIPMRRLRARDIDGDQDRDIVLETLFSVPLAVWINDGSGNFNRADLDDYRPQLSKEEAPSFNSDELAFPSELTDDCPRGDAVPQPSGSLPELVCVGLFEIHDQPFIGAARSSIRPRSPPLSA